MTYSRSAFLLAALCVACGGSENPAGTGGNNNNRVPVLSMLTVTLTASSLSVGQTSRATAGGIDQNGAPISISTVSWTSSNPTVATVTSAGTVSALAPGSASIIATVQSITGQAAITVIGAPTGTPTTVTLSAAGQSTALLDSPNIDVALAMPAGAQYLVAVVNTDPAPAIREDFTLVGSADGAAAASATSLPALAVPRPTASIDMSRSNIPFARDLGLRAETHVEMLEENRRLFASRGNPRAAWARASSALSAALAPPISSVVGQVNKVYVKNRLVGSCTAVDSIGARTVAVGQHVIVVADTNLTKWPQAFRPDSSFYQQFADEYDQLTYPHTLANIGDPLAYDRSLSNLGKITVTLTPVLNNLGGATGGGAVVAFVNGCDFFPYAATGPNADASNQTEMFYSWVPASNGDNVVNWQKGLRATAAHETKHIVSYTDRILNDSPAFEETWLEEGLAQISSEIWERSFNQATFRGNATFVQTVACELSLGPNAPCDIQNDRPRTMVISHLPFFFNYLQAESSSRSEGLGVDTPANYGAGWTFARWATDQYAGTGEGPFIKSLINERSLSGLANLALHTGQSQSLLLVYWNLATAIFQTPTFTFSDQRATTPSFNFADIFRIGQTGLTCNGTPCGLFTSSGTPVYPIQPTALAGGTFSNTVTSVPGTSAVFYLVTASGAATQRIRLIGSTGGDLPLSSGFRMAILRVK